jgi:hypothetical protein
MIINKGAFIAPMETARAITDACRKSGQLRVEAVITPANKTSSGPARIISLSTDGHHRNFTIGQERDHFILRLRTPRTGENGTSPETRLCSLTPGAPHHLIVMYRDNVVVCFLNGKKVLTSDKVRGDFSNWNSKMVLIFGDEWSTHRYWKGSIRNVRIHSTAPKP